jgi:hypothetical protein
MRASYVMVAKPIRVPKANGRFREQAAGSGFDEPHRGNEQGKEKVGPSATSSDGSQAAPMRGRLRPLRQILLGNHEAKERHVRPPRRPRAEHIPNEGVPCGDTRGRPPLHDHRHQEERIPCPQDQARQHRNGNKVATGEGSAEQDMGARKCPILNRRKSTFSAPSNFRCHVLPQGAARRRQGKRVIDMNTKDDKATQARPRVVEGGAGKNITAPRSSRQWKQCISTATQVVTVWDQSSTTA